MTTGIRVTLQPDGSLLFQAGNQTRSDLALALRDGWHRAESDFCEMVRGEYIAKQPPLTGDCYNLEWLNPEDIFALTDMPMLADNSRLDNDDVRVYGPVWGFPDYCLRSYLAELATKGRVIFSLVADYGDGMTFPSRHRDPALANHLAHRAYETCNDNPIYITEDVPDPNGDDGETMKRLVDIAPAPPPPTVGDLFA